MKVLISVLIFFSVNWVNAQTDTAVWIRNLSNAENLYELIKNDPVGFDRAYPSATLEEVDDSLNSLKEWLKWLKSELSMDSFFFPGVSGWKGVESGKRKMIQQVDVLDAKINELQEKRNAFLAEIDDSLKPLKEKLKRLKNSLAKDNFFFPNFLPKWKEVESHKRKLRKKIAVLDAQINALQEKRNTSMKVFKPLGLIDRCQMGFQRFLNLT